jgi:CubicO group peptidase (beta-lactamase class C family)
MKIVISVLALLFVFSATGFPAEEAAEPGFFDPIELEGFLDGLMEAQLKAHHFAGAVVVVVDEGRIALQKGYGYADFAGRKAVDPERTLFRIASNSKMFVWTAVMQLVEQGEVDLHTDINRYLKDFQVPAKFPQPITLENLMTHTSGFEDRVIKLFVEKPEELRPLAELMRTQMPQRVFPPGQVAAYSNYGTTLAALIVQQVSGIPYERYLEEKILKPLGMDHATLVQPLPEKLAGDMSKGYQWTAGRLKEHPFEYVPWGPCGGMSVSGGNMARFMMAHLNDGMLGEARILRPETARLMRTRLSSPYGMTAGMLHGFFPMDWNGEKIYGHGGDTIWFHSLTAMMPEHNLGIFAAYNTDSGSKARDELAPAFFDHYFPQPLPKEPPPEPNKAADLARFAGTYFTARASFSDVTKIMQLMTALTLKVDKDGYLESHSGGEISRWRRIEPLLFRRVDGPQHIVFREDDQGEVTDLCTSPLCVNTMQKQPWWENPQLQWIILIVSGVFLFGGLIGMPIAAVLQRHQQKPKFSKFARAFVWTNCLLWICGFASLFAALQEQNTIVLLGIPKLLRFSLGVLLTASLFTLGSAVFSLAAWRRGWWKSAGRISLSLIVLGFIACVLWLNHWNLLGFRY